MFNENPPGSTFSLPPSPALKHSGQVPMHIMRNEVLAWCVHTLLLPKAFPRNLWGSLSPIILLWTALEKLELGAARAGWRKTWNGLPVSLDTKVLEIRPNLFSMHRKQETSADSSKLGHASWESWQITCLPSYQTAGKEGLEREKTVTRHVTFLSDPT